MTHRSICQIDKVGLAQRKFRIHQDIATASSGSPLFGNIAIAGDADLEHDEQAAKPVAHFRGRGQ